jgi:signal transduction histidine kinase
MAFCGHAVLSDAPLVVEDAPRDPRFADHPAVTGEPHLRFYAGQSFHAPGGQRLGTLCIIGTEPRPMPAADLALLRDLAALVEREIHANELAIVSAMGEALAAPRSAEEIANEFLRRLAAAIGVHSTAVIVEWEQPLARFHVVAAAGPRAQEFHGRQYAAASLPRELVRTLVTERQPFVLEDSSASVPLGAALRRAVPSLGTARTVYAVPLVSQDVLIGALVVGDDDPNAIAPDQARLIHGLSRFLAGAMHNGMLVTEVAQRASREATQSRAKSEFLSMVAHEFRTPLASIQGFSEMIRDEDLSADELHEAAEDINGQAKRLGRMINELLELDRLESEHITLDLEALDLNRLLEDTVRSVAALSSKHAFKLELGRALPYVTGDRDKMIQVVTNLLSNAVKYSPEGGTITARTRADDEGVHIEIQDEGIGIPTEALESIFDRYARVESPATRTIQGTGLGLPIVRQIVKIHGGSVWATSTPGEGTVFHVTLPGGWATEG